MKTPGSRIRNYDSERAAGLSAQRRVGFTLVEMMVTLVIMMLLFGIIFVPLNQAFNFFHLGQTRTNMQQAARQTLELISNDLRTAVRVFPNDVLPGITNQSPYDGRVPYIQGTLTTSCSDTAQRRSNSSRIDFIPARVDSNGSVVVPVNSGNYLVTYYARRFKPVDEYEPITNPVLLFRAQSPISDDTGPYEVSANVRNVDTRNTRYTATECTERGSRWLYQNTFGEPIGLATTAYEEPSSGTVAASDVRAIPLGVSLTAPRALLPTSDPNFSLTPLTTFTLADSNDDGRIDQVKINLGLESYDTSSTSNGSGERPNAQIVRMSTTVDLPNVM